MNSFYKKITVSFLIIFSFYSVNSQDFQGKAYYFSKSTMELGSFGATMSEAQKNQIKERLKNRLEKTYILSFNKEESTFKEEEKVDAYAGATDTWGLNFTPGKQYKNIKTKKLTQKQEFYGKQFLIKDDLLKINWQLGKESKQIGNYMCQKAVALIPTASLTWYDFSWDELTPQPSAANDSIPSSSNKEEIKMTQVIAWYTPQIPLSQGPLEYWGLPGLILEINVDNTTILCSKIIMNPGEKLTIKEPEKGKIVSKKEYKEIITGKMIEMRNNRGRRRGGN